MIIAIDGPAASGKSTIAKLLAKELNFVYLDTGSMYRMITLYCLDNCPHFSLEEVVSVIPDINISFLDNKFLLNGLDVEEKIRTSRVNSNVSFIASIREVREFAVNIQRNIAEKNNSILDGRDIGTVVFPNAEYKFFFIADPKVRAKRRYDQNLLQGINIDLEELTSEIIKRDHLDATRSESPLKQGKDSIVIDTSNLSIENTVFELKKYIKR